MNALVIFPDLAASVFWACLFFIAYTYVLYPVVLFALYSVEQLRRDFGYLRARQDRRVPAATEEVLPAVTIVMAAYNEGRHLRDKIANLNRLDYPPDKLQIIAVSDGSSDQTNDLLREAAAHQPSLHVIISEERRGKVQALGRAIAEAQTSILLLCDAATLLCSDTVRKLVRHFDDPTVGAVCGTLIFKANEESQQTEGVYWGYECMLRLMESRLGATLTASGALYAIRRDCYEAPPQGTLIEDFIVPMSVRKRGFRVLYDPEAIATEFAADTVAGEFTRRVRIAVGSFQALPYLARIPLDFYSCLALFSHKFLRWVLPFLATAVFLSNLFLLDKPIYVVILALQIMFYLSASLGYLLRKHSRGLRFAKLAYYILAMNAAFLVGFIKFVFGRQEVTWQRVN